LQETPQLLATCRNDAFDACAVPCLCRQVCMPAEDLVCVLC
jgi:hypothetical protein